MHTRKPYLFFLNLSFSSLLHKWLYGTMQIEIKLKGSLHNLNSLYEHITIVYKEISFKKTNFFSISPISLKVKKELFGRKKKPGEI